MASVDRVQGISGGLAIKAPCRVATTGNVTLSGFQTIDGVALAAGDANLRVLVRSQSTSTENGIYDCSSGAWSRAKDFDGANDVVNGTQITITSGTTYAGAFFTVVGTDPITPGTTSVTFTSSAAPSASAAAAAASAAAALVSETNADASEAAALTSKNAAAASETLAQEWAVSAAIVEATDYSSKQWATKLAATVDGSSYSAKQYAANASADAAYVAAQLALVSSALVFPWDGGSVADGVISASYDLGSVP